jgi:pyruvate ferredoxin oxidoreductase beta subunit
VEKAKKIKGPAYIHVFSVCPTGWRGASNETIKLGRMVVETGIFPLYEVENGKYRLTIETPEPRRPVGDYLKLQGRFRHLDPGDIVKVQALVDKEYRKLIHKVETSVAW